MGIGIAVRALETHGQAPALARPDQLRIARRLAVPGKRDPLRHANAWCFHVFDKELEARAAFEAVREAVDHADDSDVAAFVGTRQAAIQCVQRNRGGPYVA